MVHRLRTIDVTLPLAVVVGVLIALPPRSHPVTPIPVTGTIDDPCSGEKLVLGGTADVQVRSAGSGDGGYRIEVSGDLAGATATTQAEAEHDLDGVVSGKGETYGPYPAALDIDGLGTVANRTSGHSLTTRVRFQVLVAEDGSGAPAGSVEVAALECVAPGPEAGG